MLISFLRVVIRVVLKSHSVVCFLPYHKKILEKAMMLRFYFDSGVTSNRIPGYQNLLPEAVPDCLLQESNK